MNARKKEDNKLDTSLKECQMKSHYCQLFRCMRKTQPSNVQIPSIITVLRVPGVTTINRIHKPKIKHYILI